MSATQLEWLESDLAANPTECIARLLAPAVVQLGTAWQQPRREAILVRSSTRPVRKSW